MGEGLQFATLATLIGKKDGAVRGGVEPVTIGAVGWRDGERFVMGASRDGTVVLGRVRDFSVAPKRKRKGSPSQGTEEADRQ